MSPLRARPENVYSRVLIDLQIKDGKKGGQLQACSKCGASIVDRTKFCSKCGTKLSELPPSIPTSGKPKFPKWGIAIIVLSLGWVFLLIGIEHMNAIRIKKARIQREQALRNAAPVAEPTIHDIVEQIRRGHYSAAPSAQLEQGVPSASGQSLISVTNFTPYALAVFFDGPTAKSLLLAPRASQKLELSSGMFHIGGRVSDPNVLPFYGEEMYA